MIFSIFVASIILALFCTRFSIFLAPILKTVDLPDPRKVHAKMMPRIGGVGIFFSWILVTSALIYLKQIPATSLTLTWLLGALFTFSLGFADDRFNLSPKIKFLGQFAIAILLIYNGFCFPSFIIAGFEIPRELFMIITFFWIVGVGNAINLIDGLDGLAAGLCLIALAGLAAIAYSLGDLNFLFLITPVIGSVLGFLWYNRYPAQTFMGDCGSLLLGYQLATLPFFLSSIQHDYNSLLIPLILLGVPIFDTVFAMIRRVLVFKKPFQADREHIHHRLMQGGLKHSQTVHALYKSGILLAIIALLISIAEVRQQIGLVLLVLLFAYRAIRRLGYASDIVLFRHNVKYRLNRIYYTKTGTKSPSILSTIYNYVAHRTWIHVGFDILGLVAVWIITLFFRELSPSPLYYQAFTIHLGLNLAFFYYYKCYSDISRYADFAHSGKYIKATVLSGISLYVLVPFLTNGDFIGVRICMGVTTGYLISTLAFRLAHNFYFKYVKREIANNKEDPKIIIYGAGDSGSTLLRLFMENDHLPHFVIGFIDDQKIKQGLNISGKYVLGDIHQISEIYKNSPFEILLLSSTNIPQERVDLLIKLSQEHGFKIQTLEYQFQNFPYENTL
jgi:UDP-GlcNAc:undecaprenyl-phosphate/decaprenyl-phosphate GlcNAc-1-phosphate transferase